ncbi:MAG: hypothetical protein AB7F98_02830 [Novosphingobium sp.]
MHDHLLRARDHIFQVFDQNHDGINNCRMCSFNLAKGMARELIQWEQWFSRRYYRSASGLSNIYYTIDDNSRDPVCRAGRRRGSEPQIVASPPRRGASSAPEVHTTTPVHDCANSRVPVTATWKFYRQVYGGGGTAYSEKRGKICYGRNYYYTFGGGTLTGYRCTGNWANCRPVPSDRKPITKTQRNSDGSTSYYYKSGSLTGWGTRSIR